MKSKVYFCNFRTTTTENLQQKLTRLLKTSGLDTIDFKDKYVAIKIHFGEPGNLAFLRPNWAKTVADFVKERGGKPFLTDCNTLYPGGRKNGLDHISSAYLNGFTPFSTGCHVVIGDGIKGTDEAYVPVVGGEYVKEAKIGRAVMDADIIISLNHFKGHPVAGFGGAMKNLGMGCGSRAGKMEMHCDGKPVVSKELCVGCKVCARECAHDAISFDENGKASIDHNICAGCGRCLGACIKDAVKPGSNGSKTMLNLRIAEYTKAVVDGRPNFHISLVRDVSPECDCFGRNDVPIVPDVGMFASFDPVAIDKACVDAVNAMPANPASCLCDHDHHHEEGPADHFRMVHPDVDWPALLEHGEKLGIGTRDYELVKI